LNFLEIDGLKKFRRAQKISSGSKNFWRLKNFWRAEKISGGLKNFCGRKNFWRLKNF